MKTFTYKDGKLSDGIAVTLTPYPHIVLGEGGHKRATWVPLGKRDAEAIITRKLIEDSGQVITVITDVGVIALNDEEGKPKGRHLIVAPRGADNRVLVLWHVASGFRGSARITPGEGVRVVARDSSWHSGQGSLGSTAEMLAILAPGQELNATRSGRRVQCPRAKLVYDGQNVTVTYGGDEMEVATAEEIKGELL